MKERKITKFAANLGPTISLAQGNDQSGGKLLVIDKVVAVVGSSASADDNWQIVISDTTDATTIAMIGKTVPAGESDTFILDFSQGGGLPIYRSDNVAGTFLSNRVTVGADITLQSVNGDGDNYFFGVYYHYETARD